MTLQGATHAITSGHDGHPSHNKDLNVSLTQGARALAPPFRHDGAGGAAPPRSLQPECASDCSNLRIKRIQTVILC
eukprot:5136557-Amphidinium_carterae.2